ncbi:hypothetical protein BJ508DRAFT_329523 [Ascobolus immersus RN42]|uniref:Uncharacterized protein n=1 Tax=Ascobolus immersus RN42 TaxID=1160509 RepID=A0A3N4HWB8_ASCIM|nr:hypothetical protein BJ508DRAFT_329523 [Ascobolus immersus RN42]
MPSSEKSREIPDGDLPNIAALCLQPSASIQTPIDNFIISDFKALPLKPNLAHITPLSFKSVTTRAAIEVETLKVLQAFYANRDIRRQFKGHTDSESVKTKAGFERELTGLVSFGLSVPREGRSLEYRNLPQIRFLIWEDASSMETDEFALMGFSSQPFMETHFDQEVLWKMVVHFPDEFKDGSQMEVEDLADRFSKLAVKQMTTWTSATPYVTAREIAMGY